MNKIKTTLILVYDDQKILLGMKKRGFGAGKWNGFGGKIRKNEDIITAACRELTEESGLHVSKTENVLARGHVNFIFDDKRDEVLAVHFFSIPSGQVTGSIRETEEMRPQWFMHKDIPYDDMWVDDRYWMPHLLSGKDLSGRIIFTSDGTKIIENAMRFS